MINSVLVQTFTNNQKKTPKKVSLPQFTGIINQTQQEYYNSIDKGKIGFKDIGDNSEINKLVYKIVEGDLDTLLKLEEREYYSSYAFKDSRWWNIKNCVINEIAKNTPTNENEFFKKLEVLVELDAIPVRVARYIYNNWDNISKDSELKNFKYLISLPNPWLHEFETHNVVAFLKYKTCRDCKSNTEETESCNDNIDIFQEKPVVIVERAPASLSESVSTPDKSASELSILETLIPDLKRNSLLSQMLTSDKSDVSKILNKIPGSKDLIQQVVRDGNVYALLELKKSEEIEDNWGIIKKYIINEILKNSPPRKDYKTETGKERDLFFAKLEVLVELNAISPDEARYSYDQFLYCAACSPLKDLRRLVRDLANLELHHFEPHEAVRFSKRSKTEKSEAITNNQKELEDQNKTIQAKKKYLEMIQKGNIDLKELKEIISSLNVKVNELLDDYEHTPIHVLAEVDTPDKAKLKEVLELIGLCIEKGVNINAQDNLVNETALFGTYRKKNRAVAEFLLLKGANPNIQNVSGDTVFHYACFEGDEEMVKLILKYNPELEIKNNQSKTGLDYAKEKNNTNVVNLINKYVEFKEMFGK